MAPTLKQVVSLVIIKRSRVLRTEIGDCFVNLGRQPNTIYATKHFRFLFRGEGGQRGEGDQKSEGQCCCNKMQWQ